jgi:endonuclease/exonuclease/phosphatase family metal-dependent hydrolase
MYSLLNYFKSVIICFVPTLFLSTSAYTFAEIRVISWNLESGGADINTLTEQISKLDKADIYGFSEVDSESWAKKITGLLNKTNPDKEYAYAIGTTGGRDKLTAVYDKKRFQIIGAPENLHFFGGPSKYSRSPLALKLKDVKYNKTIFFIVNHLNRKDGEKRHEQSEHLRDWIANSDVPVISVGDFNYDWDVVRGEVQHDKGFDILTAGSIVNWIPPNSKIKSQCSDQYNSILDFIFITKELNNSINTAKILFPEDEYCLPKKQAKNSDHRPLFAAIHYPAITPTNTLLAKRTGLLQNPVAEKFTFTVMAANITSGAKQSYDEGHGIRIFQGLNPDITLIQEMNFKSNTPKDYDEFKNLVLETENAGYFCAPNPSAHIPNGIISRFKIIECGYWDDNVVSDREHVYAKIDLPGNKDLLAISVHLKTKPRSLARQQAHNLVSLIKNKSDSKNDYLVIGGDFNSPSMKDDAIHVLDEIVDITKPSKDNNNNIGTNANRNKPYDLVLPDDNFSQYEVPLIIANQSFIHGIVFDSRIFEPISAVYPVKKTDSGSSNMQHMAIMKNFSIPLQ